MLFRNTVSFTTIVTSLGFSEVTMLMKVFERCSHAKIGQPVRFPTPLRDRANSVTFCFALSSVDNYRWLYLKLHVEQQKFNIYLIFWAVKPQPNGNHDDGSMELCKYCRGKFTNEQGGRTTRLERELIDWYDELRLMVTLVRYGMCEGYTKVTSC